MRTSPSFTRIVAGVACACCLALGCLSGCSAAESGWDPSSGQSLYDYDLEHDLLALSSYEFDGIESFDGRAYYLEGDEVRSKVGIDVSDHQEAINWSKVAASGVDFALVRCGYRGYTEGQIQADERFETNFSSAKSAGFSVGVYFYSQALDADEGREEAEYVLDLLGDEVTDLPVVFDLEVGEDEDARTKDIESSQATEAAVAFCETIEAAGRDAMVYVNKDTATNLVDLAQLQDCSFWYAEYGDAPSLGFDFGLWQYSDSGQVFGIDGDVDLDLWFDGADLAKGTQSS